MNIQEVEDIARFSLRVDLRPQYLKDIEEKQKQGNGRTEPIYYANFLYTLAKFLPEDSLVLELGALHGTSTAHLAAGCLGFGRVESVDINPNSWDFLQFCQHKANRSNVLLVVGDSIDESSRLLRRLRSFPEVFGKPPIHLLFVDSVHEYEHARKELTLYVPLMENGGVVILDDIKISSGMLQMWNEITYPKVELNFLHEETGFGAFVIE